MVVFANGKTGAEIAELAKQARALHDDDVKILAVAMGDDVSHEELRAVANVCVYATPRDQDSDVTAQNIARLLDMLSGMMHTRMRENTQVFTTLQKVDANVINTQL